MLFSRNRFLAGVSRNHRGGWTALLCNCLKGDKSKSDGTARTRTENTGTEFLVMEMR